MNSLKSMMAMLLVVALTFTIGCKKEEVKISEWIVGTWNLDKYTQETFESGTSTGLSESLNQGQVIFNQDETGADVDGNFVGDVFNWGHTETILSLTVGVTVTDYNIVSYSATNFVFSLETATTTGSHVETWYLSK